MKKDIDYSLIWKFFNDKINQEEIAKLQQWISADPKHLEYFNKLKEKNSKTAKDLYAEVNSNEDWKKVINLSRQKHIRQWRIGLVAASLVFIVALGYLGQDWYFNKSTQFLVENISFDPGVKKATLVLNNGQEILLDESKDTLIRESNILIKNTKSALNYVATSPRKSEKEFNKLIVPRGAEYYLELSDGTKIWLNSESAILYPLAFDKKERKIELIGEAYFEVKSDSLSPFIVVSGNQVIKVLGTSFNVKAYDDEPVIATSLVEGTVQLMAQGDETSAMFLSPGYQSIYEKETNDFKVDKVNLRVYVSWKDGRFYFREMPIKEITKILSRWYNVDFKFKDNSLEDLKFNGNLARYDNIQPILNQLSKTNEITFYAYGKTIYVK